MYFLRSFGRLHGWKTYDGTTRIVDRIPILFMSLVPLDQRHSCTNNTTPNELHITHRVSSLPHHNSSRLLLQLRLNSRLQAVRLGSTRPSSFNLTITSNQELLEIPLDPLQTHNTRLALLHPLVHRLDFVAVDFRFAQYGEGDAVVDLAELLDFVVAARVLRAELVAREADDFEVGVGGFHV